ncbi:hypothetical protein DEHRE_11820 [Dehalobacter restrictus DSM 9455]|uniref:Holin-like toxin n=1 Tax=Dehalobacter restrictus (strain DSM 9455 / PER-K23) TaxID=871738 RepID=A0ABM5P824_DEHRP|nr:hypothetical protein DEHRE_11820 [Dehalobacter restrictus DSM 9455]
MTKLYQTMMIIFGSCSLLVSLIALIIQIIKLCI